MFTRNPKASAMASLASMRAEEAKKAALKTPEARYTAMQLREGVKPSNLKPYNPPALATPMYGKSEPGDKLNAPMLTKNVANARLEQQMPQPSTGSPIGGAMPSPAVNQINKGVGNNLGGGLKKGGKVAGSSKGSSASKRGDGIAQKGKTKGRMI